MLDHFSSPPVTTNPMASSSNVSAGDGEGASETGAQIAASSESLRRRLMQPLRDNADTGHEVDPPAPRIGSGGESVLDRAPDSLPAEGAAGGAAVPAAQEDVSGSSAASLASAPNEEAISLPQTVPGVNFSPGLSVAGDPARTAATAPSPSPQRLVTSYRGALPGQRTTPMVPYAGAIFSLHLQMSPQL